MSKIWVTSDLHLCHNQEFVYKPRGFNSIEEMNEAIVERWNKVVDPSDEVFNLGDFAMNDVDAAIPYINRLNGKMYWIIGNHDTEKKIDKIMDECDSLWNLGHAYQFKYNKKYSIYLSHYPTLTANYDEKHFSQHVLALHGHTHQRTNWINPKNPFTYHVGMDSHDCTPILLDEVIADIKQRWNEIGQLPIPVQPQDTYPYGGMI